MFDVLLFCILQLFSLFLLKTKQKQRTENAYWEEPIDNIVVDYIASMTDDYFIDFVLSLIFLLSFGVIL